MRVVQPASIRGEEKLLAPITFEAISAAVLAQELASIAEIGRIRADSGSTRAVAGHREQHPGSCRPGRAARADRRRHRQQGSVHLRSLAQHSPDRTHLVVSPVSGNRDQRATAGRDDDTAARFSVGAAYEHDRHHASGWLARPARDRRHRARPRDRRCRGTRSRRWQRAHERLDVDGTDRTLCALTTEPDRAAFPRPARCPRRTRLPRQARRARPVLGLRDVAVADVARRRPRRGARVGLRSLARGRVSPRTWFPTSSSTRRSTSVPGGPVTRR